MSGVEVGFLEPHAVDLDRRRPRSMYGGYGAYKGASLDSRVLREWHASIGSADRDSLCDLQTLRARSRDAVRNEPLATGALSTIVTSTVGTGINPQPRIDRKLLGLSETEADQWESDTALIWAAVTEKTDFDIERRLSFADMTAMVLRSVLESGDIVPIRRYREDDDCLLGLKLQLIEADRISNPYHRPDTPLMTAGVEFDRDGQVKQFHARSRHPGDFRLYGMAGPDRWDAIPVRGAGSRELQAWQVYDPWRPGQTRGIPLLAPVLEPLKSINRFTSAELEAAVIASFFTVFLEYPGVIDADAPPLLGQVDSRGVAAADEADLGLQSKQLRLGQGMITELAPGYKTSIANPGRPNDKFDPFLTAIARQIGVAIDVPYEFMIKHFTSSYSASRAALLELWRSVLRRRAWLVRQWCQPVYEMVILESIARGLIRAPGFTENPLLRHAWSKAVWVGPSQGQIDPLAEVEAASLLVEKFLSTTEEQTYRLTGGSWEANHRQQVKERQARERDGLTTEAVAERVDIQPREPIPPPGQEPKDPPDEDEVDKEPKDPPKARAPRKRETARSAAARRAALSAVGTDG